MGAPAVASHERVKRNGEWTSTDPQYFNVTLFGQAAEDAGDTLHKGDRVTVEGRPELELFDRRDGSTGAAIKVYARTVTVNNDEAPADRNGRDADQDMTPTINHTAEATMVVGVGRTATALDRTLKDHGLRWAPATTSWNLPADMDHHTRPPGSAKSSPSSERTVVTSPSPTNQPRPAFQWQRRPPTSRRPLSRSRPPRTDARCDCGTRERRRP